MTLPVSRSTTYSAGSQVKSADLNAIQDEIVNLNYFQKLITWLDFGATSGDMEPGVIEATLDSNCTAEVGGGSADYPHVHMEVESGASGNDRGVLAGKGNWFSDLDDTVAIMETRVRVTTDADRDGTFYVGFHGSPTAESVDTGSANDFIMVGRPEGETNWFLLCADNSARDTQNLGVAEDGSWFHVRLEYHGVNTPLGVANSDATVRVLIDGVQVIEHVGTNVPTGSVGLRPLFYAGTFDPDLSPSARVFDVGPARIAWSLSLAM